MPRDAAPSRFRIQRIGTKLYLHTPGSFRYELSEREVSELISHLCDESQRAEGTEPRSGERFDPSQH